MTTARRTVLVTGGAGGIGRVIVRRFADTGARVVILDRNPEAMETLLANEDADAVTLREVDVSDRASVDHAIADLDRVDVLVNAAAVIRRVDVLQMSPDQWQSVLDINLTGPLTTVQAAAPLMSSGASIVNIASINGERHNPLLVAYGVSKAGLLALTKGLAVALAPRGIRVNAVIGGHVLTEFSRGRLGVESEREKVVDSIPLGRLGTPEDFANAVVFLAGPDAGWITGSSLNVDGGWLAADTTSIPVA